MCLVSRREFFASLMTFFLSEKMKPFFVKNQIFKSVTIYKLIFVGFEKQKYLFCFKTKSLFVDIMLEHVFKGAGITSPSLGSNGFERKHMVTVS